MNAEKEKLYKLIIDLNDEARSASSPQERQQILKEIRDIGSV